MNRTNLRPQLVAMFFLVVLGILVLFIFSAQREINERLNNSSWTANHFILNYSDGRFIVDKNAMAALDISGRVKNAPKLSEVRISQTARLDGRWTYIKYNGNVLLERTTEFGSNFVVEFYDVSDLVTFYGEQSFACEEIPLSIDYAQDGYVGSLLIIEDRSGDGRADTPVIFRTFVPESPGMSSSDLEPPCVVK